MGCSRRDALAITLGFRVGEVLLRSSRVWVVPEGDALAMTLGFRVGEVLLRSCRVLGCSRRGCTRYDFRGFRFAKCYCVDDVCLAKIYKNTHVFECFWVAALLRV